jgi:hypothetical protein
MTEIDPATRFNSLNETEKKILQGFCNDLDYKDIGKEVFLAENTIKNYMGNIFEKLGVTHLEKRETIATIFTIYCPMLKRNFLETVAGAGNNKNVIPELQQLKIEEETPEPISEELLLKVEEVENKLSLYEPTTIVIPPKKKEPRGPNRNCFRFILWPVLIAVFAVGAFLLIGDRINTPNILGTLLARQDSSGDSLPIPTDLPEEIMPSGTPVIIVVTATSPPASKTPVPSYTPVPANTQIPTNTTVPSPTPFPDTAPGSILELGEWWKKDGVWLRISEHEFGKDDPRVYIKLEFWNQTENELLISWNTSLDFTMKDNTNHIYSLIDYFANDDNFLTVQGDTGLEIRNGFNSHALLYYDDYLYNSSVTELILTVHSFSRIEEAQFRIPIYR